MECRPDPDLVREAGGRLRRGRGDHRLDPHDGLEMVLGQSSASAHLVVTCWCRLFLSRITPSVHQHSVTSHSLQLTPVCPALAQYTIHSVDMLKRANSDKINPCIYLYDNIKLDLLKLCRVLIAIWYLDNTLMLAQTFLPTANTIRIQFRLISHFCPDPREDVS